MAKLFLIAKYGFRVSLIALGCVSVAWSGSLIEPFWRATSLEKVATVLISGESYRRSSFDTLRVDLERIKLEERCNPIALRAASLIRLEIAENSALSADRDHFDNDWQELEITTRTALRCNPVDSFLWLTLYRATVMRDGFKREDLAYLQMSYRLGPREGWIALRRNWLAMAVFTQLPPDLADDVVREFAGIVDMGASRTAATILEGPGWIYRDRLLAGLANVSDQRRRAFSNVLYRDDIDLSVPGIPRREPRPWD